MRDPLAPHINEDGRAFNGNYVPILIGIGTPAAIGILVAISYLLGAIFDLLSKIPSLF